MKKLLALTTSLFSVCLLFAQGNVGIGTNHPVDKLTLQTPINTNGFTHIGGADSIIFREGIGGVSAAIGTATKHIFRLNAGGLGRVHIYPTGEVVVGSNVTATFGKLTVETLNNSYGISHLGEGGNVLATRMGGTSAGIGTFSNTNMRIFSNSLSAIFIAAATGNVGIGTDNPVNKLQIGNVSGYQNVDLAIGNGANSLRIQQTGGNAIIASTTSIVLSPAGTGPTRGVGINTFTPLYPLQVADEDQTPILDYAIFGALASFGNMSPYTASAHGPAQVSIYAQSNVMASEFDARSDARIKNILGRSNTATDLAILNSINVTDYTLKDVVKNGRRPFKKVIAQEVETVYPQVVTTHTDFIPNVYQVASAVARTAEGYRLTFAAKHNISKGAKQLQVLLAQAGGMQAVEIVSLPSEKEVVIRSGAKDVTKAFVYGEEVDDFRTVDYEGLTTLNISATQELSKLVKAQQAAIDALREEVKQLKGVKYAALRQ